MRKKRYLLCFLFTLLLAYYAGPRLVVDDGMAGLFAVAWTSFAILTAAGNVVGMVRKQASEGLTQARERQKKQVRSRHY
ncbi:hypothetical protein [Bacillus sp. B-jedd]|uniref:hypothetical protein n=1 Tax=Bacillus sp. B-jedd TaxID=1476857 RepID=UPI00051554D6|nr:hypothetical protein [Bacillus sp. B-jedd]CEG28195.1 hypothetical protein BN1002_03079 [Bacillus sp. B-jedd]